MTDKELIKRINILRESLNDINSHLGTFCCYRCRKKVHIPYPPKDKLNEWGIFSWTCFMGQYIKWQAGWSILDTNTGEYICPDCRKTDDITDQVKLKITDKWLEEYNKWRKENNI